MKVKYAILGAGISGLAFAGNLNSNNFVVLEKESDAGGLCRTHKACGEYIWDFAGHFFHFKNEESRRYFEPVLQGSKCVRQIKNTKINFRNSMIDYPFQKNIHQLKKEDFIDCLYDLFLKKKKRYIHHLRICYLESSARESVIGFWFRTMKNFMPAT